MGVFDKIKNALFEVEYVEVEEKPKKEKTIKPREKTRGDSEDKPIAKKIVLPGKREEKVEQIEEEEMKDDNFEIRPINETVKESKPAFKFMDDDDFAVDSEDVMSNSHDMSNNYVSNDSRDYDLSDSDGSGRRSRNEETYNNPYNRPIHASRYNYEEEEEKEDTSNFLGSSSNEDDYDYDNHKENVYEKPRESTYEPPQESIYDKPRDNSYDNTYDRPIHASVNVERELKPYGGEDTTFKAAKEYGSYDKKDEKSYFKPSPIISPIYGILDKNYKKEDVVAKKEIRVASSYSRSNVNVDDVRNKAYGRRSTPEVPVPVVVEEPSFEVEEDEDENLLVDLSDEREKPEVKSITVGDAMEYFDDLGLEYNVDYVDATNKNKKKNNDLEEDIKNNMSANNVEKPIPAPAPVPQPEFIHDDNYQKKEKSPIVDIKDESNKKSSIDDEDNLFDLIDSMYKDED